MVSRRTLLGAAAAWPAGLPRPADSWVLAPVPDEHVVLTEANGPTRVLLPRRHSRLLSSFRLMGIACSAASCLGRTASNEDMDLLVIAGGGRILGLEPWSGTAGDGSHFSTHLALAPAGDTVILRRDAAAPGRLRSGWTRESWTDYLVARDSALVEKEVREPPEGTWQANMSHRRSLVMDLLPIMPAGSIENGLSSSIAVWPWIAAQG